MIKQHIAFVCLHGSAKSLIAAAYVDHQARHRDLQFSASASGIEPDAEIPLHVVDGLLRRGIDVRSRIPQRVTRGELDNAGHIVSFGCDLTSLAGGESAIEHWDECPTVSEDFDGAWSFITGHVEQLMQRLDKAGMPVAGDASDRRSFLQAAAIGTAALAVGAASPVLAQVAAQPPSGPHMIYTMKPLPFDPQKIKGLSEKILVSHYENNYGGAVKRLNSITDQLASLDYATAPVFQINGLKREELIALNSMILHEFYFAGLGEQNQPGSVLTDAIARDFGSLDRWRTQFVAMGKAQGGGSGWVILTYSPRDKRLINAWAADHTTTVAGGEPILVLDMYEHAYQMDFGAKAADYVTTVLNAINWSNADRLYAQANRG
jgi:superoxide dismutase, Fe-Mn family